MYYPQSHITPNQYSNGELSLKNSKLPYTGYYFSTFDDKAFTGRYPGDGDNLELNYNPEPLSNEITGDEFDDLRFYGKDNSTFSTLNNIPRSTPVNRYTPTSFYPQPNEQDYSRGEFTRYFAKKTNENIYTEVSGLFQNSLYIGIKLPWLITGDKDEVYNTNKNIVELREQENQIEGLGHFLRFNYLKFYK